MKKAVTLKVDQGVGAEALRILRAIPDLDVAVEPTRTPGRRPDAVIEHAGNEIRLAIEFKRRVDAAVAHSIVRIAGNEPDTPLLLVAGETTTAAPPSTTRVEWPTRYANWLSTTLRGARGTSHSSNTNCF